MALTRDFKVTVAARVKADRKFARALLDEAGTLFLNGDPETAKLVLRDLVNATMSQLPDHYREMLEGKYVHGKSQREMAEASQQSEKAIESQLMRARKAFRATFLALSGRLQPEVC